MIWVLIILFAAALVLFVGCIAVCANVLAARADRSGHPEYDDLEEQAEALAQENRE